MLLAGLAAEELVFGEIANGGGGSMGPDMAYATQIGTEMKASHGFGNTLEHLVTGGSKQLLELLHADHLLGRGVEVTFYKVYEDARTILE